MSGEHVANRERILGFLVYLFAGVSFVVQQWGHLGYSTFATFIVPALPWGLFVVLLLSRRSRRLRCYWWVLPSFILANPTLVVILLMMLAWSIGGFAP